MSQWGQLCLPQHVKMYDPTNREGKAIEEDFEKGDDVIEDDTEANEDVVNEDSETCPGQDDDDRVSFEKDKIKYGQEVKFHYLITETGDLVIWEILQTKAPGI